MYGFWLPLWYIQTFRTSISKFQRQWTMGFEVTVY
jgi:hypothetical protein